MSKKAESRPPEAVLLVCRRDGVQCWKALSSRTVTVFMIRGGIEGGPTEAESSSTLSLAHALLHLFV
jgi:hypothetical protein